MDQWASIREEEEKSPHQFVIHNIDQDPQHNTWQVIEKRCLVCFLSLFFVVAVVVRTLSICIAGGNYLRPVEINLGPGDFKTSKHMSIQLAGCHLGLNMFLKCSHEQEYLLKKTQPHHRDRVQLYDVFEGILSPMFICWILTLNQTFTFCILYSFPDPSERKNVASQHPEVILQ